MLAYKSQIIVGLDDIRGLFPDDDAGSHGMTGGDHRHDGCIGDSQFPHSVNPENLENG